MIDAETQQVTPLVQDIYPINNLIQMVNDISNKVYKKLEDLSARQDS